MIPSNPRLRILSAAIVATCAANVDASTQNILQTQTPLVTNCNDSGTGSLRDALLHVANDDVISLASLVCSKITLSGQLSVSVHNVDIQGNGITIDGNGVDRVLAHGGHGTLTLSNVTLQHGVYLGPFGGGCIYSAGNVQLLASKVSDCLLYTNGNAYGGGIYAIGGVVLGSSTVSDSHATSTSGIAKGGGVYSKGDINVVFDSQSLSGSTIEANSASAPLGNALGGGLFSHGYAEMLSATISGNTAYQGAALVSTTAMIDSSTISGNSSQRFGAVVVGDLNLYASTITANLTTGSTIASPKYAAGLYTTGHSLIFSSIIAGNLTANHAPAIDLAQGSAATVAFTKSLVMKATFTMPDSVIRSDPKLGPLAFNGGRTKTHALLAGSPAIDKGEARPYSDWDQRGRPFARTEGEQTDIGAIEFSDRLFFEGFDP